MSTKKKLLTTLSVVLILGMAALGILAYLSDTDSDVNVMTLGNVDIEQTEKFDTGTALYPGDKVEKEVTVTNVGESDAYVRTLFAFENPIDVIQAEGVDLINTSPMCTISVDGTSYSVFVVDYGKVEAGKVAPASLKSVSMSSEATNDHVARYGDTYDVLVLSQAVQVEGFNTSDAAFEAAFPVGDDYANVQAWFAEVLKGKPTIVGSTDEFMSARLNGGNILLTNDISVDNIGNKGISKAATINGSGNKIVRESGNGNPLYVSTTEPVEFKNVVFETVKGNAVLGTRTDGANITVTECTFNNLSSPSTGNTGAQVYAQNVTITFNKCKFNNMPIVTNSSYKEGIKLVFNDCEFNWEGANCPGMIQLANYVVADIDFNNCKYTYNAPLTSTRTNEFVDTSVNVGAGTTIDFNNFEMVGTAMDGKIWSIVSKVGTSAGNNVTVKATGTNSYIFNGSAVDFYTYLFK